MALIKISVITVALLLFIVSCDKPASNTGTGNTAKNGNGALATNAGNTPQTPAASPPKDETAQAADLYTVNCMTCHRDKGKGGKVTVDGKNLDVDDLTTDKMKKRTDDKLAEQISEGAPDDGMPAFKDKLKPAEIAMVVKHLRTLQAK
jgi:mono/diheme cytochrome c family protein